MESKAGIKLINTSIMKKEKESLFQKWLHDDARYEVSLNEYIEAHMPYQKSSEEEKNEILKKFGGGVYGDI